MSPLTKVEMSLLREIELSSEEDGKVDLLTMSKKELTRVEVMQRLKAKRLSQAEASAMLGISVRQVKRLVAA